MSADSEDIKTTWARINAAPIRGPIQRYEPVRRAKRTPRRELQGLKGYFYLDGRFYGPRGMLKVYPAFMGGEERYHIRREGRRWWTLSELMERLK